MTLLSKIKIPEVIISKEPFHSLIKDFLFSKTKPCLFPENLLMFAQLKNANLLVMLLFGIHKDKFNGMEHIIETTVDGPR